MCGSVQEVNRLNVDALDIRGFAMMDAGQCCFSTREHRSTCICEAAS